MRRSIRRVGSWAAGVTVAAVLTLVVGAPVGAAADEDVPDPPPERLTLLDGWTFTVAPYLWLSEVHGRMGARGASVGVDVGLDDVVDLIGDGLSLIAAFGRIEAQRGPFSVFVDTALTRLDTDKGAALKSIDRGRLSATAIGVDAALRQDAVITEFGLAYRVLEYSFLDRSRPFALEMMVGGRYYYYWTQVEVKASAKLRGLPNGPRILQAARRNTTTIDWADPLIGMRWSIPVLESVDLKFRGDVGGFEAGSDLAWSLTGLVTYALPLRPCGATTALALGYRILDFDYESGGKELDLSLRGPVMGLAVQF